MVGRSDGRLEYHERTSAGVMVSMATCPKEGLMRRSRILA
jgi:hypothetical protein